MDRAAIKQRFGIIGDSPRLNAAIDIAMQAAPTEVSVLVSGENGTGKDIFSQILHQLSRRKHKPFIAINCGAIPEGTIDSELFGHEKGSFTSAYDARKGYFEEVNGGMIFLDEIAELPLSTQSRLLRVLENGEYLRVGSSKVQKTDVRVVAASNKNLVEAIRQGKFREDLFFRLNTVTIYVPPLRERGADIELLVRYFANEFAGRYGRAAVQLDEGAKRLLYDYHWPGNVRELRNFVEKITVLSQGQVVNASTMEEFLPLRETRLPVLVGGGQQEQSRGSDGADSELIVMLLRELRGDMGELKRILAGLTQGISALAGMNPNVVSMNPSNLPTMTGNAIPMGPGTRAPYPEVIYAPAQSYPNYGPAPRDMRDLTLPVPHVPALEESLSIERKERDLIARALSKHGHNRKKAASELGISERTLYRKIKSYGLEK
jgi:transcriptional regulator with PAS, ATPase and Fis domain